MKIYVIQKGEYSDRHIVGVTDDKNKAKKLCDMLDASFSEFDTEQFSIPNSLRFEVWNPSNSYTGGWIAEYDDYDIYDNYKENAIDYDGHYIIYADSPQQAIKIAQDMRAEKLAKEKLVSIN